MSLNTESQQIWQDIASHLVRSSRGESSEDLKQLVDLVAISLQSTAGHIEEILRLELPIPELMNRIDETEPKRKLLVTNTLDDDEVETKRWKRDKDRNEGKKKEGSAEEEKKQRIGETKSSEKIDSCLTPSQIRAMRKIWDKICDIDWPGTQFQDYRVQGGMSEDGCNSITGKQSRAERSAAILNYFLGLTQEGLLNQVIPDLRATEHNHVADAIQKALEQEDDGKKLTTEEILSLVNPRRMSGELYRQSSISEDEHADLTCRATPRTMKTGILRKIPWVDFLKSLQVVYPHFYRLCVNVPGEELMDADVIIMDEEGDKPNLVKNEELNPSQDGTFSTLSGAGKPIWCFCCKCRSKFKEEAKCCIEGNRQDCLSTDKVLKALIAGGRMLKCVDELKGPIGPSRLHTIIRRCLYRQLSVFLYGHLGPSQRIPLPSCCMWKIRENIPDPRGKYEGFKPGAMDIQGGWN